MKNVILILLVLLLCSCSYQPLYKQYNYASISSSSLFVIDGEVYNLFSGDLPFTIYNPNPYPIIIDSTIDFKILPYSSVLLEYVYAEDRCLAIDMPNNYEITIR